MTIKYMPMPTTEQQLSEFAHVWNWPFFIFNFDASFKPEIRELKAATMLEF